MKSRKNVPLKPDEIKLMRSVCQLAARTLEHVGRFVKPGISTLELDEIVQDFTKTHGATNGPLGYHGFPKSICTSVNEVVCHGLPDETILKLGDIVNVDVTPVRDGFFGDTSATFMVGEVDSESKSLVEVALLARDRGIEQIRPGGTTGDIGFEVNKFVTRRGYTVVEEIGGHGIGRIFHADPFVPSIGKKGHGEILVPWTCITVEPMVNQGTSKIRELSISGSDIKYYLTADGKRSAQFEHTVLITDKGFEVLTLP